MWIDKAICRAIWFFLGSSLIASMACAGTFGGPYEIKSFIVGGYGLHVEVSPTPSGCTSSWEGTQFVVPKTQSNFSDMLSATMAAHMVGKPVIIFWGNTVQGNSSCGWGNQLVVDAIQVKK